MGQLEIFHGIMFAASRSRNILSYPTAARTR